MTELYVAILRKPLENIPYSEIFGSDFKMTEFCGESEPEGVIKLTPAQCLNHEERVFMNLFSGSLVTETGYTFESNEWCNLPTDLERRLAGESLMDGMTEVAGLIRMPYAQQVELKWDDFGDAYKSIGSDKPNPVEIALDSVIDSVLKKLSNEDYTVKKIEL